MTEIENKEKPPGLFDEKPWALLALLAAGTGVIALGSLGVEIWTDRWMAKVADVGVQFVSAPLGAATLILAALTARKDVLWSVPAFVLGVAYWIVFVMGG